MNDFMRAWKAPLLAVLATAAIMAPMLWIGFVNDDLTVITYAFTNWKPDLAKLVTRQEVVDLYYRPLVDVTFAFDYAFWGLTAVGYRLTNLLIHLLNVLLVYYLARRLLRNDVASLAAALLFGAHPIHETSVLWVPGRTDMLCCLWYLIAIHLTISYVEGRQTNRLIGAMTAGLLALLSKEMAMSLPVIAAVTVAWRRHATEQPIRIRELLLSGIPFLAVAVAVFAGRVILLDNNPFAMQQGLHANASPVNLLKNIASYIGLLAVPAGHYRIEEFLSGRPAFFLATAGAALTLSIVLLWRLRRSAPPFLFATAWTLITLIPVSRLAMRWYLYIPSVGFCLGLGWLLGRLAALHPRTATATALSAWLLYASISIDSEFEWIDAGRIAKRLTEQIRREVPQSTGSDTLIFASTLAKIRAVPVFHLGMEKTLRHALNNDSLTVIVWSRVVADKYPTAIEWESTGKELRLRNRTQGYLLVQNSDLMTKRRVAEPGIETHIGNTLIEVTDVTEGNKPSAITIRPQGEPPKNLFIFDGHGFVRP